MPSAERSTSFLAEVKTSGKERAYERTRDSWRSTVAAAAAPAGTGAGAAGGVAGTSRAPGDAVMVVTVMGVTA
ncbi:hypothetical protein GCM10010305_47180 [Streptomyces termitum]|uniref:Uncharacterized protein n=1 Tax=Streptomyces termitum TaxID=67368 RepID=A0A918WBR9_9ACTN|nr:hypothetical protein GCM10010305_47180 [Streptomyces termitum]